MDDKFPAIVQNIIKSSGDSINWSKALVLIDLMNQNRQHDESVFRTIHEIAIAADDRATKLRTITFIDALFKNGNQNLLMALQNSNDILGISDELIIADPHVHRVLCTAAESWAVTCQAQQVLYPSFIEWQYKLYSFKYKYVMTSEMMIKFSSDFSEAFELLSLFSAALIDNFSRHISSSNSNEEDNDNDNDNNDNDNDGNNDNDSSESGSASKEDKELSEMNECVKEVYDRLTDLETTLSDCYALSIVHYLEDFCEVSMMCYSNSCKTGEFNTEVLSEILTMGIPEPDRPDGREKRKGDERAVQKKKNCQTNDPTLHNSQDENNENNENNEHNNEKNKKNVIKKKKNQNVVLFDPETYYPRPAPPPDNYLPPTPPEPQPRPQPVVPIIPHYLEVPLKKKKKFLLKLNLKMKKKFVNPYPPPPPQVYKNDFISLSFGQQPDESQR